MDRGAHLIKILEDQQFTEFFGEVTALSQNAISADGPASRIGDICRIGDGPDHSLAQVVAIDRKQIRLLPFENLNKVSTGDRVLLETRYSDLYVGDDFSGRAVNGFGEPIDNGPAVKSETFKARSNPSALSKSVKKHRVRTGLRVMDALFPIAKGQRIGIFAASGVGKTTLVEQLSTHIDCDRVVLCLIGERGREVERLWSMHEKSKSARKVTLIAATSDDCASARVRAMEQALALCEYWREKDQHVVLFVDSVTRLAMALREIGLAAGEPPSVRSYTPNVFAALPGFVERCGAIKGKGAVTAIFTVLSETDDVDDPIVETMKSILDGHIVLSRRLADKGHFPAVDIGASISRIADEVLGKNAQASTREIKRMFALFEETRAMIDSGLYQRGSNAEIDRAIELRPQILDFVVQSEPDEDNLSDLDAQLEACINRGSGL